VSLATLTCLLFILCPGISPNADDGADARVASIGRLHLPLVLRSYFRRILQPTMRVSVASDGTGANNHSQIPSVSADGRYVAFCSNASNLVSDDTNDVADIFLHEYLTGQTTRVSVTSDGIQANAGSDSPFISADGRYVTFTSIARNLVSGDTNGYADVFVHDRQTAQTTRVSVSSAGAQANNGSWSPSISADGRYIAFHSLASNLVSGDTNAYMDAFVHDRQTGQTTRVSLSSGGVQTNAGSYNPSISADGRYVAFRSEASNLVVGDTNLAPDIFVHDRQTGQTSRVSMSSGGVQANGSSTNPSISADGRYVAFRSHASNLVIKDLNDHADIFVHDRHTGETTRVSVAAIDLQANGESSAPSISANGRYVAFYSAASNLVNGDTNAVNDVFVYDRLGGQTMRVSVTSKGTQANGFSDYPSISACGRYVAFRSGASNLVSGDTNGVADVFVHDRGQ
jgi:Tol biopolymer transport system component